MDIQPVLKVARFEQLAAGDLFLYPRDEAPCVGMAVIDPAMDNDKALILLGPKFPFGLNGPTLSSSIDATMISFEKNFRLLLPIRPSGWRAEDPDAEKHCLAITDRGAYFRVAFGRGDFAGTGFCYIDAATGLVVTHPNGASYARPAGIRAFALEWEIVTLEKNPRTILSVP